MRKHRGLQGAEQEDLVQETLCKLLGRYARAPRLPATREITEALGVPRYTASRRHTDLVELCRSQVRRGGDSF